MYECEYHKKSMLFWCGCSHIQGHIYEQDIHQNNTRLFLPYWHSYSSGMLMRLNAMATSAVNSCKRATGSPGKQVVLMLKDSMWLLSSNFTAIYLYYISILFAVSGSEILGLLISTSIIISYLVKLYSVEFKFEKIILRKTIRDNRPEIAHSPVHLWFINHENINE